jgi:hypothetical protein
MLRAANAAAPRPYYPKIVAIPTTGSRRTWRVAMSTMRNGPSEAEAIPNRSTGSWT